MKHVTATVLLAVLATSCSDFPRDPSGTLERVRHEGRFRVGIIAGSMDAGRNGIVPQLLERIARQAHAAPVVMTGNSEALLSALEDGRLQLVVGSFERKSPWNRRVTIGPPLRREKLGKADFVLAPAMQNGENAWIALIEREVRNVAPEAQ